MMHTTKYKKQHQGVTLFEVLLYISLFSYVCISSMYLYISISNVATKIRVKTQKAELSLFIYEIVRYKLDHFNQNVSSSTAPNISVGDFYRILQYYPNFKMQEITLEHIKINDFDGFKITYSLSEKETHTSVEKIFTYVFYVIM